MNGYIVTRTKYEAHEAIAAGLTWRDACDLAEIYNESETEGARYDVRTWIDRLS